MFNTKHLTNSTTPVVVLIVLLFYGPTPFVMLYLFAFCLMVVSVATQQCSFNDDDISARWQVSGDELTIEFVNKQIANNKWTGIGFGPSMENLEVVVVKIEDNKPSLVTGFTSGYGPPSLDSNANVVSSLLQFNSNQLTFRFTRPLNSNGARKHSLEECQKWNFVKEGEVENGEIGSHSASPSSISFISSSPLNSEGEVRKHKNKPTAVTVCPKQCRELFQNRDVLRNPVPQKAIYNNHQSSRFDGLH
ncbi:DOMON domain protein [Dictyocaulus viviparus]|uniref:DOMON domain protein n=1 Tax=Dictyocaulus viviparus TaxID=29172 RepID=A0A0D8XYS7_DICVI|nr:DOMON domain protein [Dictyocaulus viviparus]